MESFEDPPTYNRTNKFTKGFQTLIDAYGVASYREMNPAPYTIITFPFLFAVMFGDTGHGLLLALFGGWMVLKEKPLAAKKTDNEIWNIFFGGRYIIFLMGLFSMYTGIIYNDVFSKSLNIFGSNWKVSEKWHEIKINKALSLEPNATDYEDYPYPIGMDPVWQLAENKILFLNSYKMKISIIFGILHMIFGVVIGLKNHLYFKKRLNITCEFIPQIIFLVFIFWYLTLLMFIKWVNYSATNIPELGPRCAPSVLITFINMVLMKSSDPPKKTEELICDPMMFSGQEGLQKFLLVIAVICVPWMLFAKPYLILRQKKMQHQQLNTHGMENGDIENGVAQQNPTETSGNKEDEHDTSEIFIYQGIHTIEYVLGSVSHTASYLRLWALSLAHARKLLFFYFSI